MAGLVRACICVCACVCVAVNRDLDTAEGTRMFLKSLGGPTSHPIFLQVSTLNSGHY